MPRRVSRLVHWLVIITLIASTLVVPAQATEQVLQQAATRIAAAMADMPCGDEMATSIDAQEKPCNCCTEASCDLSACLGTAYLHALPCEMAAAPLEMVHLAGNSPPRLSRPFDTLLRPPIA